MKYKINNEMVIPESELLKIDKNIIEDNFELPTEDADFGTRFYFDSSVDNMIKTYNHVGLSNNFWDFLKIAESSGCTQVLFKCGQ
jgi:hypothetical protein